MPASKTPSDPGAAIAALDRAVRAAARNSPLNAKRKTHHHEIRGWTSGGCLVFADGIRRWLGRGTTFVGVSERPGAPIEHVAAVWNGLYLDALGCRDLSDFEFDCVERGGFRTPTIRPISDLRTITNISHDVPLAMAVARTLQAQLDPQPSLSAISDFLRAKS